MRFRHAKFMHKLPSTAASSRIHAPPLVGLLRTHARMGLHETMLHAPTRAWTMHESMLHAPTHEPCMRQCRYSEVAAQSAVNGCCVDTYTASWTPKINDLPSHINGVWSSQALSGISVRFSSKILLETWKIIRLQRNKYFYRFHQWTKFI